MGNSASNSQGRVDLCLEKNQYHAGEVLNGYVNVTATSPMQCTNVYATLRGEVRTCIEKETRSERRGDHVEHRSRTHQDRETVLEEKRLVARFPHGYASPGSYQFPFQFALHALLPSSAQVEGFNTHAGVTYTVEVHVERPGMLKWDLVQRSYFDLVAQVPHAIVGTWTYEQQDVVCCCCRHHGAMQLGAQLEKNAFVANEAVLVHVQLSNESQRDARSVNVVLREHIHMRAERETDEDVNELARTTLPAVPRGQSMGPTTVRLLLPAVFKCCSLQTRLLQIRHVVEVEAITPCCNGNPTVKLPVTLYRSPTIVAYTEPPRSFRDETVAFAPSAPYQPDPNALSSPEPLQQTTLNAVMPSTAQALALPPMQQPMMRPGSSMAQPLNIA